MIPVQSAGTPISCSEPLHRHLFELGCRGRRAPEHRLHVEGRGQRLGGDRRGRRARREVRKKARVVPVRDAGQDDRLEVLEDSLERFRFVRGPRRQPRRDLARTHAAEHRVGLGVSQVLFDPAPDPSKVILDNGLPVSQWGSSKGAAKKPP